jgi:hypothetical protein
MRTLTLSLSRLRRAVRTGHAIADAWARANLADEWQAALVELARIPAVQTRIRERQTLERIGCPQAYGSPVPLTDLIHRLPGYLLPGWSSGPRAGWDLAHAPSNCWNGIRRNLYGSLPEQLHTLVLLGPSPAIFDELARCWHIRIAPGTPPHASPRCAYPRPRPAHRQPNGIGEYAKQSWCSGTRLPIEEQRNRMLPTCHEANAECDVFTRCTCFACGETTCRQCSTIRNWYRYKRRRICDSCAEDADRLARRQTTRTAKPTDRRTATHRTRHTT